MATRDSDNLFDLRTVKRNIRASRLSRTAYAEFLESLPDMADNVMAPDEREDEDAFEDIDSPEPDVEQGEVQGASVGSTTFAEARLPAFVPATRVAHEAAPVQPPAPPVAAPVQPPAPPVAAPVQRPAPPVAAPAPVRPSSSVMLAVPEDADPFADAPMPGQPQTPPAMPLPDAHPAASDDHEPDGD